MGRNRIRLYCYFCGGREIALAGETVAGRGKQITSYRCEAEGVRWDMVEGLVIYGRDVIPRERGRSP